jgi:hypothetical protein
VLSRLPAVEPPFSQKQFTLTYVSTPRDCVHVVDRLSVKLCLALSNIRAQHNFSWFVLYSDFFSRVFMSHRVYLGFFLKSHGSRRLPAALADLPPTFGGGAQYIYISKRSTIIVLQLLYALLCLGGSHKSNYHKKNDCFYFVVRTRGQEYIIYVPRHKLVFLDKVSTAGVRTGLYSPLDYEPASRVLSI